MSGRSSALTRELEQLLTLTRAEIESAHADARARARLVEFCVDEEIELREEAESAHARGDEEHALHCAQEASAWRHTARILRSADRDAAAGRAPTGRTARLA